MPFDVGQFMQQHGAAAFGGPSIGIGGEKNGGAENAEGHRNGTAALCSSVTRWRMPRALCRLAINCAQALPWTGELCRRSLRRDHRASSSGQRAINVPASQSDNSAIGRSRRSGVETTGVTARGDGGSAGWGEGFGEMAGMGLGGSIGGE